MARSMPEHVKKKLLEEIKALEHELTHELPKEIKKAAALGDLIVASMPSCVTPVRAMIDAYDRYFGQGTGEAFFMGPYLDVLPKAVTEGAKNEPE